MVSKHLICQLAKSSICIHLLHLLTVFHILLYDSRKLADHKQPPILAELKHTVNHESPFDTELVALDLLLLKQLPGHSSPGKRRLDSSILLVLGQQLPG